ncbi:TPA: hypothetical protein NKA88_004934 [Vibrio parahaemolyticus]|uniref:hypothetical protein n=1 Tax=Vibrio parahaemolyticus TaxID=670 RepID=UPI0007A02784|nr:hypothetical protein [Vibrio parahaemolyticus]EGQ8523776.1 hypothetical protein [Vibrio parahaemolyticus]EGQ9207772.1 hypothetical protein [Vibrio parahaemolyticus]EGQ9789394.1 hypothetical protein [Vibrio parahaemolyticus]EGQ9922486.1 hypothetical protein [Vibrio parahaemolyticus]EGR0120157.1 hypothetical protein [Vibrio parahaemolyticus]
MKKTVLALLMMSASVGAMAQSDIALEQKKVDSDMGQLQFVHEEGAAFIMIDADSSYEMIEYVSIWVEENNYVSNDEAKKRNLEKLNKQFVYAKTGESLEQLEAKVIELLNTVNSPYFGVDVYRDYHGDSGEFNYLARIIEYK